jgi:hypothetical protein
VNINQSDDFDREPIENKQIVSNVMELLLGGIQKMYEKIGVQIFSEEFYSIARYCRIWNKMTKILIFLIQDRPDERKIVLYSQLYVLSDNYTQIIQKLPYGMVEVPYYWFEASFHISLDEAEWADKLIVFKFLTDGLTIRPCVAPQEGSKTSQDGEEEEEDYSYEIKVSDTQVIACKTVFVVREFATPTTLRLLALNGVPIGVSAMIFDARLCEEFPVCFLIIHPRTRRLCRRLAQRRFPRKFRLE